MINTDKNPRPSGLYATIVTPNSRQASTIPLVSISRVQGLYSILKNKRWAKYWKACATSCKKPKAKPTRRYY